MLLAAGLLAVLLGDGAGSTTTPRLPAMIQVC
jgi:hypothetical protein